MTRVVHLNRRINNTVNTPFYLKFVERIYVGAPRWWAGEWAKHAESLSDPNGDVLEREAEVKKLLRLAHDPKKLFNENVQFLIPCVTPNCPLRAWSTVHWMKGKRSFVLDESHWFIEQDIADMVPSERADLHRLIGDGLATMAGGTMAELKSRCPQCNEPQPVFGVVDIKDKWVYVLKGGGSLEPHAEINIESPSSGSIHREFKNKQFTKITPFHGYLALHDIHDGELWNFFLSPVRLGPEALSLLSQAMTKGPPYLTKFWKEPLSTHVNRMPTLQPWDTFVSLGFSSRQTTQVPYEFIPLVDITAWVAQVVELDYLPVIAARQQLILHPNERAEAFIAATLAPARGHEQNLSDSETSDPWSLKQRTVDPLKEFQSSKNIATAWIDRYEQALEYLSVESNYALLPGIFSGAVHSCPPHR